MLPHVFVRSGYSGKDMRTQRKLMVLTPILQAFVWTGTMLIGLIGIALLPGLTQSDTELIIPYMIQNVIQSISPGLAVFLMLAFSSARVRSASRQPTPSCSCPARSSTRISCRTPSASS